MLGLPAFARLAVRDALFLPALSLLAVLAALTAERASHWWSSSPPEDPRLPGRAFISANNSPVSVNVSHCPRLKSSKKKCVIGILLLRYR